MKTRTNWSKQIHRMRLHRTLDLPDKIPASHEQVYYDVTCYADCLTTDPSVRCAEIHVRKSPPSPGRKSSQHRVFIKCEGCGRLVPTGRYHQHSCCRVS